MPPGLIPLPSCVSCRLAKPTIYFVLAGFRPNPASASRTVAFTLASAEPATLALIDVRGRTVVRREVGSLGPGPHSVDMGGGALAPGVYWLRLVQGGVLREARGVVARSARIE